MSQGGVGRALSGTGKAIPYADGCNVELLNLMIDQGFLDSDPRHHPRRVETNGLNPSEGVIRMMPGPPFLRSTNGSWPTCPGIRRARG